MSETRGSASLPRDHRLALVTARQSNSSNPVVPSLPSAPFLQEHRSGYSLGMCSKNGCALPAAMGVAAKRACRLQERRSGLRNPVERNHLTTISCLPGAAPDACASFRLP